MVDLGYLRKLFLAPERKKFVSSVNDIFWVRGKEENEEFC